MKKRILSLLLALVMVIGVLPVIAQAEELDNGLQYEIIGDHVEISGYIGDATELAIPARILGLPVTSIGAEAFFCCSTLTSIELPDSITSIGTNAFYGCVGLTNIVIPEGITAISDGTFFNCSGLTDIVIPEGITSIGEHAFYRCDSLTSILIPDSVSHIGFEAFALCSNLLEIQVDEHNRHYSSDNRGVLFDKEKSLLVFAPGAITDSYEIPEGVTGIGEHAFFFCHYLTAISIPDSVAIIGDNAIYSCGSLNEICVDENNRYFSSDNRGVLFNKEKSLLIFAPGAITGSYQIPNGVTSIGDYAFNCCSNLTGIIIPEGVTSIGISSFSNCQCLTAIDIPKSVTAIGDNAFSFCSNLSTIRFAGNAPEFGDSVFSDVTATACYPADDPTWTNDVMQNYNGTINWIPWDSTHTHDYSSIVTSPTCTEQGYTTYTCDCGDSYVSDHVDALGHDMGKWQTVIAPTCTENGSESRSCSRCGSSETRAIEATGHSHETVITAPTCTEQGFTTYTCGCGDSYVSDHVDALGHDYNGGICTRCGEADPDYQPPEDPPFTDVPTGSFYEEPVLWAVENGITNGATDETFNPNGQCMRAQVVTFLWRTAGCPEPNTSNNPFVDVNPSDYYYKAVLWAVENGITNGADATHFNPFGICNRAQVVTFLYRAQTDPQAGDTQGSFSDVADDAWYSAPIEWAASNEITNGLGDGTFGINTACNRAQVVTFLYRAYT